MKTEKTLVPIDFSASSEAALAYAIDLSERLGGELILLHAVAPAVTPVIDAILISTPHALVERFTKAGEHLEALRQRVARPGVSMRTMVVQGASAEEIVRVAEAEGCDLIVMGTHGRTGLPRAALGSVATRVLRTATVPVLTVRADRKTAPVEHWLPYEGGIL